MALSANEWIELILGVSAVGGTIFAVNKWYYDRIREEIQDKSTTSFLKVLVDENTATIRECKKRIVQLERRVVMDFNNIDRMQKDTEEIKNIVQEFSGLKSSMSLLQKNYSDLQRMIFFKLQRQGKPPE